MQKVILWLADNGIHCGSGCGSRGYRSGRASAGSFVALCLFGIIYVIISSTRY